MPAKILAFAGGTRTDSYNKKLKELMKAHPGLLLSCPEYNSSLTALLQKLHP